MYTRQQIESILKQILQDTPVKRVVLFGSYAKDNATEESDLDFVIDSDGTLRGLDFFGVLETMAQAFHVPVDVIELSQIEAGSRIAHEVEQTGVIVYETENGADS
ncbi:nucleotidyltransferase family protein [Christensenella tenuis]|uniref:Nucleotidyltransferase domain-containing protein n=1 Tax=Christensenella tenuis TaxID=2763033 RepID=A0ABR7EBR1_9FIRM|nr:nucleotidyltransferase domain-containing protein [Christensenella tenuis]MBC5646791.1 nucleotidyltransferase domain-containing protein [Christensenella tenuis]